MARLNWLGWVAIPIMVGIPLACGGRNLNAFLLTDDAGEADGGAGGIGGSGLGGDPSTGGGGRGGGVSEGGFGGVPNGPGSGPSSGPGGPQDCIACAATNCPEAIDCFTDQACIEGVTCGVSQCLGGSGSPDFACFLECFNGDVDAAITAFQAVSCVFMSCADECGGLLGGGP